MQTASLKCWTGAVCNIEPWREIPVLTHVLGHMKPALWTRLLLFPDIPLALWPSSWVLCAGLCSACRASKTEAVSLCWWMARHSMTLSLRSLVEDGTRPGICPYQSWGEAHPLNDQMLVYRYVIHLFLIYWMCNVDFCLAYSSQYHLIVNEMYMGTWIYYSNAGNLIKKWHLFSIRLAFYKPLSLYSLQSCN